MADAVGRSKWLVFAGDAFDLSRSLNPESISEEVVAGGVPAYNPDATGSATQGERHL